MAQRLGVLLRSGVPLLLLAAAVDLVAGDPPTAAGGPGSEGRGVHSRVIGGAHGFDTPRAEVAVEPDGAEELVSGRKRAGDGNGGSVGDSADAGAGAVDRVSLRYQHYSPSSIPIAVLVCSGVEATRETLQRLELAKGFTVEQLHVFQDAVGHHPGGHHYPAMTFELQSMVNSGLLLEQNWHRHAHPRSQADPSGERLDTHVLIARHYRYALSTMFHVVAPRARYVMVLEEDLLVSMDILQYFAAVAPVLDNDPTLFAASAWNDIGFTGMISNVSNADWRNGGSSGLVGGGGRGGLSIGDGGTGVAMAAGALVNRVDSFPGLGWLCPRRVYVEELEGNWPDFVWDVWVRLADVRRGE